MPISLGDLIFRTADMLKWGAGKGSNLTLVQGDLNIWNLFSAIEELQENGVQPLEIQAINVTGNQMMIILSDGTTTFGPYTLPVAAFRWRDEWEPDTAYLFGDLFTAPLGMYLVLQAHTSSDAPFNPADGNMVGPYAQLIFPFPTQYDIGFFFPGIVGAGIESEGTIAAFLASRPFYIQSSFPLSRAKLKTSPAADLVFNVCKNGVVLGTVTFATGETDGVFDGPSDDVQFVADDVLEIVLTDGPDASARDLKLTIVGTRGSIEESS